MSTHDFKLKSLIRVGEKSKYLKIDQCKPQTEALVAVHEAFLINIKRIHGLAFMPLVVYAHSWHYGRACAIAAFNHTGSHTIFDDITTNYNALNLSATQIKNDTMEAIIKSSSMERNLYIEAAGNVNTVLAPQSEFEHIHPWLGSMLISEWSAFEILATDLWVAAVNNRPRGLGKPAFQAGRRKDDDSPPDDLSENKKSGDKKPVGVSLDTLQRYGYNLSNRMGDMLKAQRKWSFNSAKSIRFAYTDAFGPDAKWMQQCSSHKSIAHLEAARHLLVHRAGVVDESFLGRIGNDSLFAASKLNERLSIDGEMVALFMDLVIDYSCKYIKFVDEWLVSHPE